MVRDGLGGGDDEVFTYDDLGRRLTQVDGAGTTTFAYDSGTGELASMIHPVDGVTTFDYDAAGRRVAQANPTTGVTTSYVYDPAGRLAEVGHDTASDDWTETHVANGDGLLSRLTVTDPASGPDEVTDLTWDPTMGIAQVAAVDRGSGAWDHLAYGQGRLASLRPDTTTAWFATDHLGSATATPDTAALTAAESYGAWGENRTGPTADLGLTFGYRGEATTSDHIYLRARTYQPGTGQFLTRDPLDGVDGTTTVANPWHYTNNDPVGSLDPSGLRVSDECLATDLLNDGLPDSAVDGAPWDRSRERSVIRIRSRIEGHAQRAGISSLLLAITLHHEGGNYLDRLRRPAAQAKDRALLAALLGTRQPSVGAGGIQPGTAEDVLTNQYCDGAATDQFDIGEDLIGSIDYSLGVMAGVLHRIQAAYSDAPHKGLFLAYAASDRTIAQLSRASWNPDVMLVLIDHGVIRSQFREPAEVLRTRAGHYESSKNALLGAGW